MSYLDVPRLHFFGQFLANPGTLNNILANYDPHNPARPLWNPRGVALFQLQGKNVNGTQMSGVTVTSVQDASGNLVTSPSQDPLVGAAVQSSSGSPAKIVDLDPWQQLISQLFGLQLQVVIGGTGSGAGFSMKAGQYAPVPSLTDLWFVRSPQGGPSGIYQTVLQPDQIQWNDPGASPLLQQFQQACQDGISVKFTVDLYDMSNASPTTPLPAARQFIDSQIYFLGGPWQGSAYFWWPMSLAPLSVVIYDEFTIPENPTWTRDVQPVLAQYMRLYPGMKQILDMSDYNVVQQNAQALQQVFSADITDPNRMPVTRDLAPAKMQMVLNWIAAGLPR